MGLRCCGKCLGYLFILTRITLFTYSCYYLLPLFISLYQQSFVFYEVNSKFYGCLENHNSFYSFFISMIIWCLLMLFIMFILLVAIFYAIFIRVNGCKQLSYHFKIFCKYACRNSCEFVLGTRRQIVLHAHHLSQELYSYEEFEESEEYPLS